MACKKVIAEAAEDAVRAIMVSTRETENFSDDELNGYAKWVVESLAASNSSSVSELVGDNQSLFNRSNDEVSFVG